MRKTIALAVAGVLALFIGPAIIYDLVTDYRYAAQDYINNNKPVPAKIHEAERKLNRGTQSIARLKVAVKQMSSEEERLQSLLAQAPMPLVEMQRQHQALTALVTKARQNGQDIEYAGKTLTPAQMQNVLSKQKAELGKYERYAATVSSLHRMKSKTEAAISQALNERRALKGELEYAKSLTKVAQATSSTRAPFEATVGDFREAEQVLTEVIALQEVRLDTTPQESAFTGEGKLVPVR